MTNSVAVAARCCSRAMRRSLPRTCTRCGPGGALAARSRCQGAAARSVSIRLRRAPPRGVPAREPTGRPLRGEPDSAPTRPALRAASPLSSAASRPAGSAAWVAWISRSSSACAASSLPGAPSAPSSGAGGGGGGGVSGAACSWGVSGGGATVARGASTSRAASRASSSLTSLAAVQRSRRTGGAQRHQAGAQRSHAHALRGGAQRLRDRLGQRHLRQPLARGPDVGGAVRGVADVAPAERAQVAAEGQPVGQCGGQRRVVVAALVEGDDADAAGPALRHAFAFGSRSRHGPARAPAARPWPRPGARPSAPAARRRRIRPAARAAPPAGRPAAWRPGPGRRAAVRRRCARACAARAVARSNSVRSSAVQRSRTGPALARSAMPPRPCGSTANSVAAQTASAQAGCGGRHRIHAPNTSCIARSTRAPASVSSSGSRRSRWRSAGLARALQVRVGHRAVAVQRGQRARGAHQRQLAAQAVGAERHAQLRGALQHRVVDAHLVQVLARADDALAHALVLLMPFGDEGRRVALEGIAAAHHQHALRQLGGRAHFHRQAEAVEQLRAQFAFFGVAAADQHEARRMAHAQALALDHVLARGGHVDQQVDQMVVEQVDLVDVQKAAVRARQQPGLEGLDALRQRALEVERADDAVLGGAQRQVDHRHRHQVGLRLGLATFSAAQSSQCAAVSAGSQA